MIEKILNHVSGSFGGIVGVYQKHEYTAKKARHWQRWATHLPGIVAAPSARSCGYTKRECEADRAR